jgi:hypothetical protein
LKERSKKMTLSLSALKQKSCCNVRGTRQTKVFWFFFSKKNMLSLHQQSGILTDAAAQENLTTEITEENGTEKNLLPGFTIFSPCLPCVISVISVVKSPLRRRAGLPSGRLVLPLLLVACTQAKPPESTLRPGPYLTGPVVDDPHVPPYANAGWAPFSRAAAVAIALREWRLFGAPVDDDPPGARPPLPPPEKPERQQGLWQRIGEYWWEGLPPGAPLAAATGMHDAQGAAIADDSGQPWSAAFISYVMRIAGAAGRFPYSASHSTYINAAARGTNPMLHAHAPETYAPVAGDLICHGRGAARVLRFTDLPTTDPFTSHCDLVAQTTPGRLGVIGGNVDDAVTMRHVATTTSGLVNDPNYPCLVVLQVQYDR